MKKKSKVSKQRSLARKRRHANTMQRRDVRMFCMVIILTTTTTGHTRIPNGQHAFDDYIHRVKEYLSAIRPPDLTARGLVLGLTSTNITDLGNRLTQWWTGNSASPGLWEVHTNVYGQTNTSVTNDD